VGKVEVVAVVAKGEVAGRVEMVRSDRKSH